MEINKINIDKNNDPKEIKAVNNKNDIPIIEQTQKLNKQITENKNQVENAGLKLNIEFIKDIRLKLEINRLKQEINEIESKRQIYKSDLQELKAELLKVINEDKKELFYNLKEINRLEEEIRKIELERQKKITELQEKVMNDNYRPELKKVVEKWMK